MKVVKYTVENETGYGILEGDSSMVKTNDDLFSASSFEVLVDILKGHVEFTRTIDSGEVRFEAPIQPTKNVICIGKNYHDHILEFDGTDELINDVKENPIFFTKPVSSIIGPEDEISSNKDLTSALDYEGELGVVIGKTCKNVSTEEALQYVFGYTILNDVTARDIQKKHKQWFVGKGFDTFCPAGPYIVTSDEVENPQDLHIITKVNGEVRQDANTSLMIHKIADQIAFLSRTITLMPGDVLSTGTPKGVGMGFKPPRFLKSGDEVEISISKIGRLTNKVL